MLYPLQRQNSWLWWQQFRKVCEFLVEIGIYYEQDEKRAINFFGYNKGAFHVAQNNNYSERTNHIDIKIKFIIEKIDKGEVTLQYLSTDDM